MLSSPSIMRFSSVLASAAFIASTCATPTTQYAVHEKRESAPFGWASRGSLKRDGVLPMRIALTQRNLDKAYDHLMDVSHPESANFGKHWTVKDVAETFAPR